MAQTMYVYEDGEFIKEVVVNPHSMVEVKKVLDEAFDCGPLEDDEVEVNQTGDELYIGVSETQYLLNKKL